MEQISLRGDRVRIERTRQGVKAKDLAENCGISAAYLSQLETGKRDQPPMDLVKKLASELSVSGDWLLGGDGSAEATLAKDRVINEASPSVDTSGLLYGELPPEYDVQWVPGWNQRGAAMSRAKLVKFIEDCIPELYTKPPGESLAHTCHFCMDLLNEIANRIKKEE